MKNNIVLTLTIFLLCTSANAAEKLKFELLEYGIVTPGKINEERLFRKQDMEFKFAEKQIITKRTTNIPLGKNILFGISVRISGLKIGEPFRFSMLVDHPEFVLPSGEKKSRTFANMTFTPNSSVYENIFTYGFSKDYELIPGIYIFSLVHNKEVKVFKEFNVNN